MSVLSRAAPPNEYPGRDDLRATVRPLRWLSGQVVDALRGTATGPQRGGLSGPSRGAFLIAAVAAAVAGGTGRVLAGSSGVTTAPAVLLGMALVTVLVAGVSFVAEPRSWTPEGSAEGYVGRHRPGSGPFVDC